MKCLPFWAPWLWCTLHAHPAKLIDNRKVAYKHRGPTLLHCTLKSPMESFIDARQLCQEITGDWGPDTARCEPMYGKIVAVADLVDVIPPRNEEIAKHFAAKHGVDLRWWFRDHVGLVLANVRLLATPIAYRGSQGMFDVPQSVVADLGLPA